MSTKDRRDTRTLVEDIADGDRVAEISLVRRYGRGLRYIFLRETRDPAEADDLFQDCFLVAIPRLRKSELNNPEHLEAFLHGIARKLLLVNRRQKSRAAINTIDMDQFHSDSRTPFESTEHSQIASAIQKTLSELDIPRDRDLLVRRYLLDQDSKLIRADLGLSEDGLRKACQRARQRMGRILQHSGFMD